MLSFRRAVKAQPCVVPTMCGKDPNGPSHKSRDVSFMSWPLCKTCHYGLSPYIFTCYFNYMYLLFITHLSCQRWPLLPSQLRWRAVDNHATAPGKLTCYFGSPSPILHRRLPACPEVPLSWRGNTGEGGLPVIQLTDRQPWGEGIGKKQPSITCSLDSTPVQQLWEWTHITLRLVYMSVK